MQIVSNTSPLIVLKKSGAIFILDKLFNNVLIPKSVQEELFKKEKEFFSSIEILKVAKPKSQNLVKTLKLLVDEGEAEAIALAMELNLPLLIDDYKGRKVAHQLGLKIIGSLGLLKIAKERGIISKVKPFIERFISEGYYLDEKLIEQFLKSLDEA
jgi:predicted nucleic acid-binding protein